MLYIMQNNGLLSKADKHFPLYHISGISQLFYRKLFSKKQITWEIWTFDNFSASPDYGGTLPMVKDQEQIIDKYDIPVWRKYTLSVQEAAK